jgi:glycosyltransferase involved in cell wall biosynthesis
MRIVIDMQGAQTESRFRGIGRYSMSLTQAIVHNKGEHEIILALNGLFPDTIEPIRAAFDGLLPQENIRVWHAPGPVCEEQPGNEWRREVAERIREAFLADLRPDVVLVSSLFEGLGCDAVTSIGVLDADTPVAVILYDLIPLISPDVHFKTSKLHKDYYYRKIDSLKRAQRLFAISDSTRDEAVCALNFDARHIINISGACDESFQILNLSDTAKNKVCVRAGITRPFVMYSGAADERKNLHRLIQAYALLPNSIRKAHQLVFIGKMPESNINDLILTAKKSGLSRDDIVITGYVEDEDLVKLYNSCELFIFPSLHEGFGIPPLEAMRCGVPVIGANITSLPEVIGWGEALFNPYDVKAISKKIKDALADESFRKDLICHGAQQVKKFSWEESARRTITALEEIDPVTAGKSKVAEPENNLPRLIHAIAAVIPSQISEEETIKIARILSRNHHGSAQRQLLVDISELVQRDARSGVQRVTRSILKELLENPPEGYAVEPVYAKKGSSGYRYARHFTAIFRGIMNDQTDEPIEYHFGDIFLGLDLQHHVVIAQKKYLSSLRRDGVQVFFVVHDLLPIIFPHYFLPGANVYNKEWLLVLAGCDGVVCVSRAVSNELKEWLAENGPKRLRELKISWSHNGADIENSVPLLGLPDDAAHVLKEFTLRPTFLTVGTVEPRKGHAQQLGAFELLWKQGIDANFVIVGKQGWLVEILAERLRQHYELNKRLFWLEGISDEYLEKIYAASTCLIAASEGEGFCLPLIEAARHKLPIIARDIPVFREVAGEHAFYFKGIEPQALSEEILHWLELDELGKSPRPDNMPWLTWKQSADRLKQIIIEGDW